MPQTHRWTHLAEDEYAPHLRYWGTAIKPQFFDKCTNYGLVRRTAGSVKKERSYTRTFWATTYYRPPKCEPQE